MITADLVSINADISALDTEIVTVQDDIAVMQSQISYLQGIVISINSEISGINTEITAIESSIATINTNLNEVNDEIVNISTNQIVQLIQTDYNGNPLDNQTYYLLTGAISTYTTSPNIPPAFVAGNPGWVSWAAVCVESVSLSTSTVSAIYLRKNNTTNYVIASAVNTSISPYTAVRDFVPTDIPFTDDDFFQVIWITPTWVTNPQNVRITVTIGCGFTP